MSEYIKEDVEVMLRNHLKNEAKLTEIEIKIEEYEEELQYAGTVYESTEEEAIESMQLAGKGYDGVNGHTNKVSDIVHSTVANYHKEQKHINKKDRDFLERKIQECKEEKERLNKIVVRVKNMLVQLSEDEKTVIETYYMKKSKWDYVEKAYFDKFEIHKTIKQLQTYRNDALNSMLEILNTGV